MITDAGHSIFLGATSCEGRSIIDKDGSLSFLYKDKEGINRHMVQEQVARMAIEHFWQSL